MKKYYLDSETDDYGSTGATPSETDRLNLSYESDDDIYELKTMYTDTKDRSLKLRG